KLLPKEAKSESNYDSAKAGSSPSTSPLMGNLRARFRFLSPGRPALNLSLPSSPHVKKLSNLSEGLPLTCPDTKVAESKVASGTSSPTQSQPPKLSLSQLPEELTTNKK
ncbi:hypothetical protein O181_127332, partial [Austropuccinia psidii MF-1]|nr:hypothetical protein [Austropuccinia psidii MF-1]